jgi:hypothetical protein
VKTNHNIRTKLDVQASIRIGDLRFERFGDKLRICRMYERDDQELALIESSELLKLKLWLNGDL